MPRRKVIRKSPKKKVTSNKSFWSQVRVSESYVSLFLGAVFVVVVFLLGISLLKGSSGLKTLKTKPTQETSSTHTVLSVPSVIDTVSPTPSSEQVFQTSVPTTTAVPTPSKNPQTTNHNLPEKYTVKPGDDLWNISLRIYGSGYNWVDIAKTNNLGNPGMIYSGQTLNIPNEKPIIVQAPSSNPYAGMSQAEGAIFGPTYTVVKGDSLWTIAVRAYGDGYRYVDLAKVNNLSNPSLIFSGNIIKIPR